MRALRPRSLLAASLVVSGLALYACGDDGGDTPPPGGAPEAGAPAETGAADTATGDGPIVLDSSSDAELDGDAPLLSPTFVHRDINQVLATGQSLSVGALGTPALSTTQPYDNTMFVTGVLAGGVGLTSFKPLVEANVETMSSSFASLITKMAREVILVGQPAGKTSHDLLLSAHGLGGTAYVGLKKGTVAYANGIAQAQAGHDLAVAAGKTHVVRAVTNVHGESDSQDGNTMYEANLLEWQSSYESDVKAITGQTEGIPMLHTQFSSWTRLAGVPTTSIIPSAQLAAHVNAPGKIILVGAKYHLPYVGDGVHLTNEGYRHMGEDYAKVYRRVILEGKTWEPIHPKAVTRAGAVITVKMHVPAPPLVMDTTIVSDPGNKGFEWAGGGETIASVAITGPDTVVITLSAAPAAPGRLRDAFTGTAGALAGPMTGPRGNLRDSDATPSRSGYPLYNWCVHFDRAVP
ncbi:MAG TPA: hypothetical protein VLT33_22020 [Labilithrix sp.]|nr:hypothetical protein [Labilithrix sp.]